MGDPVTVRIEVGDGETVIRLDGWSRPLAVIIKQHGGRHHRRPSSRWTLRGDPGPVAAALARAGAPLSITPITPPPAALLAQLAAIPTPGEFLARAWENARGGPMGTGDPLRASGNTPEAPTGAAALVEGGEGGG